jgi:hypothetical protein
MGQFGAEIMLAVTIRSHTLHHIITRVGIISSISTTDRDIISSGQMNAHLAIGLFVVTRTIVGMFMVIIRDILGAAGIIFLVKAAHLRLD